MTTKPTSITRWREISVAWRVAVLFSVFEFLVGISMIARPVNSVNNFIFDSIGIRAEFAGVLFIAFALLLPVVLQFTQSIRGLLWMMFPTFLMTGGLMIQVAMSATAPMVHAITATFFLIMAVVAWLLAREIIFLRRVINDLAEENGVTHNPDGSNSVGQKSDSGG